MNELNNIMVSKSLILFIMHMLVDKGMSIEIIRSSPDEITGTTGICSSFNAVWMPFGCKCGLFQAETFFSDNGQHAACQNQASLGFTVRINKTRKILVSPITSHKLDIDKSCTIERVFIWNMNESYIGSWIHVASKYYQHIIQMNGATMHIKNSAQQWKGHLFRVTFGCSVSPSQRCLIFKIRGRVTYPLSYAALFPFNVTQMVRITQPISRCPLVTALDSTIPFGNPSKALTTYMPKRSKYFSLSTLVISQMKSNVSPMRSEFISFLLSKLIPVRSKFISKYISTVLPVRTELISFHVSKIYSLRWSTVSETFQSGIMQTIDMIKSSLRMTLEATRIGINMTKTITWNTPPPKKTATTKSTITTTSFTKAATTTTKTTTTTTSFTKAATTTTTTTTTTSSVITPIVTKKPSIPPTTTSSTTSSPSKGKMKVIIIATVTPLIAAMCLLAVGIYIRSRKRISDKAQKSNQVVPTKILVGGEETYNNNTDTFTPPSDISMNQLTEMTRKQATYKKL